jgi:hypothetical protein
LRVEWLDLLATELTMAALNAALTYNDGTGATSAFADVYRDEPVTVASSAR